MVWCGREGGRERHGERDDKRWCCVVCVVWCGREGGRGIVRECGGWRDRAVTVSDVG